MAKAVILPKFGFNLETADIVKWLVTEGQQVENGDPLCEVTTDKINMEVEATANGIVAGFQYPEGTTVKVTEVICYILEPGESLESIGKKAPVAAPAPETTSPTIAAIPEKPAGDVAVTPVARRAAAAEGVDLAGIPGTGPGGKITKQDVLSAATKPAAPVVDGKVNATPAARRVAGEKGINLANVSGKGPEGRVQAADVAAYRPPAPAPVTAAPRVPPVLPVAPVMAAGTARAIPLAGVRKIIAERMQASWQEKPHIQLFMEVDVTRAETLRSSLNPRSPAGKGKLSFTALIVKAIANGLGQFPLLNSHFANDTIYQFSDINVGVAVAVESGLIVPVIKSAGQKTIFQIGDDLTAITERARNGKLTPADIEGGTFTLSNLGMYGVDYFTAIINPPQVGILATGQISRRFVPDENDQPVVRSMMTISLSADHRVVDGAIGAQFLAIVRTALENPNLLLEV
jgi:pyruvate dehydrogenase E2 component (dihydrolipoamide acetyltransferase)